MASMTRIPGVALFPALGLEYLRQNDLASRVAAGKAIACIAILAVGPIVIGSYYEWRYGNPLEFLRARQDRLESRVGHRAATCATGITFSKRRSLPAAASADCLKEFAPTRALLGVTVSGAAAGIDRAWRSMAGAHARRRARGVGAHLDRAVAAEWLRRRRTLYRGACSRYLCRWRSCCATAPSSCVCASRACRSCCCSSLSSRAGARCCRQDACRSGIDPIGNTPHFASRNCAAVPRQPKPYRTLLRKCDRRRIRARSWSGTRPRRSEIRATPLRASTWLSNTKSSELADERQRLQQFARVGAIAGVELRDLRAEQDVADERQEAIGTRSATSASRPRARRRPGCATPARTNTGRSPTMPAIAGISFGVYW